MHSRMRTSEGESMRTNRINMMCHGWADAKDGMTYDFRKLTICLHDSQAQRDYLTCHQEIDSFCIIYLHVLPDRSFSLNCRNSFLDKKIEKMDLDMNLLFLIRVISVILVGIEHDEI